MLDGFMNSVRAQFSKKIGHERLEIMVIICPDAKKYFQGLDSGSDLTSMRN